MGVGGRPSKYDRKFIKEVDRYLEENKDYEKQVVKYEGEHSTGYEQKIQVKLPTHEGFALFIGVNPDTLYEWAKKHKTPPYDFSESLRKIKAEQQKRLLNKGLSGEYNSTIAKLILSSNHGMREKSDMTSGGKTIKGNTIILRDFKSDGADSE